ncbi:terpene synthase family protein [Kitasatospora sp. HPMI-4]|uniref:terpene synthase family protein n=1 Tax=Kitasatospora sp. HPMI-4 TaxID=3448443 RepID=UPI003F19686D
MVDLQDEQPGEATGELWCPFPSLVNPHAEQADQRSLAWLTRHRLLDGQPRQAERIRRQRSGHLAARTNPEVDAEMLRLLSDWYVWLFAFDDGYCEDLERGSRPGPLARTTALLARVLDAEPPAAGVSGPASAYAVALREIRDRVGAQASPSQLFRWECTVRDYLFAQVWEAANREAGVVPGPAEYMAMRRHAGATYTCLALVDIAAGYEAPPAEADGPALRRLRDITANLVSWDNDLYSHAKEKADGQGRHNLVEVLARHHHCPSAEARKLAVAVRDAEMNSFVELSRAIATGGSAATAAYARSLGLWLRGHIEWSRGSSRFDAAAPAAGR